MEKHKPERKRSVAIVIALIWLMLWSGIFFAVGYASTVQIRYFPIGTIFAILLPIVVIATCFYLTTTFILPPVKEFWKGKKEKEEKK